MLLFLTKLIGEIVVFLFETSFTGKSSTSFDSYDKYLYSELSLFDLVINFTSLKHPHLLENWISKFSFLIIEIVSFIELNISFLSILFSFFESEFIDSSLYLQFSFFETVAFGVII